MKLRGAAVARTARVPGAAARCRGWLHAAHGASKQLGDLHPGVCSCLVRARGSRTSVQHLDCPGN